MPSPECYILTIYGRQAASRSAAIASLPRKSICHVELLPTPNSCRLGHLRSNPRDFTKVTKIGVVTFVTNRRRLLGVNFGTLAMRRKFEHFWNKRLDNSACFPGLSTKGCDRRGDFWNRESSFARVLQESKITKAVSRNCLATEDTETTARPMAVTKN